MSEEIIKSGYECEHCWKEIDTTDEHVVVDGTGLVFCCPLHQSIYSSYVKPHKWRQ